MPQLFEPLTLRNLTLKNRIMMSPMCQYSAGTDGCPTEWHFVHYVTRAIGGVALIMVEATAVESRGRISEQDLGIWEDRQVEPLARMVRQCHEMGATVGLQIAHAGRKAWGPTKGIGPEEAVAPSAIAFDHDWRSPRGLSLEEIDTVVQAFGAAARRAVAAGFDLIEIHGAHGYLINQFLSPLSNHRDDEYGGSPENRMRLLRRIVEAVNQERPSGMPLFVRLSVSEYSEAGLDAGKSVEVARALREWGVDLVDCSSGGAIPLTVPSWPGYQLPFAHRIKREVGIPTAAVGLISGPEMAEEIVRNQRADLVVLGRELLRNPYWPLQAARELGVEIDWPVQYRRAKR